jgi:hypothetical protein
MIESTVSSVRKGIFSGLSDVLLLALVRMMGITMSMAKIRLST